MTVTSQVLEVSFPSIAGGVALSFPYPVLDRVDLKVYYGVNAGTLAVLDTDYTVTLAADYSTAAIVPSTGFATTAAGNPVVVVRDPPIEQRLDLTTSTTLPAQKIEDALDRTAMWALALKRLLNTALYAVAGLFDGRGLRATNFADPVNNQDLATKGWATAAFGNTTLAAAAAASSALAASNSAATAITSAATATAAAAAAAQSAIDAAATSGVDLTPYLQKSNNLAALTDKTAARSNLSVYSQTEMNTALALKSDVGHGHVTGDVTGLDLALANKSAVGHTHAISGVTGLQTALDGKAPLDSPALTGAPTVNGAALVAPSTTLGAVGTYAFCKLATSPSTIAAGSTIAGSGLRYGGADEGAGSGTPAGTWRAMGNAATSYDAGLGVSTYAGTLFVRTA